MNTMYKQALQDTVMYHPAQMRRRIKEVKKMIRKKDCTSTIFGCDECPLPCSGYKRLSDEVFISSAKAYIKAYKTIRKERKCQT